MLLHNTQFRMVSDHARAKAWECFDFPTATPLIQGLGNAFRGPNDNHSSPESPTTYKRADSPKTTNRKESRACFFPTPQQHQTLRRHHYQPKLSTALPVPNAAGRDLVSRQTTPLKKTLIWKPTTRKLHKKKEKNIPTSPQNSTPGRWLKS